MVRVFFGDRSEPFDEKGSRGGKEARALGSTIGFHPKHAPFRSVSPYRNALRYGKRPQGRPHEDRDGGAHDVAAPRPRSGVSFDPAGTE
jgi:hypothetical protein